MCWRQFLVALSCECCVPVPREGLSGIFSLYQEQTAVGDGVLMGMDVPWVLAHLGTC